MSRMSRLLAALGLSLVTWVASAQAGSMAVEQPSARATGAGQKVGGAYLTLVNRGAADRLLSASSPAAESVELHTMAMEGDVMRMRQLPSVDVPAGARVEFKPGARHLMLIGLKAPLKAGSSVQVTLEFEKAGKVTVQVPVKAAGATAQPHDMKH